MGEGAKRVTTVSVMSGGEIRWPRSMCAHHVSQKPAEHLLRAGLARGARIWHIGARAEHGSRWTSAWRSAMTARRNGGRARRAATSSATSSQADLARRAAQDGRHPLSAGAERLSAYRPRQVDLPQFRHRRGVRRPLPSALRRHQPDQGGAGIYRRHRARRALARLRLGQAPLPRLGLFRAALRLGRAPDPRRQGLCRRPVAGGDARRRAAR